MLSRIRDGRPHREAACRRRRDPALGEIRHLGRRVAAHRPGACRRGWRQRVDRAVELAEDVPRNPRYQL